MINDGGPAYPIMVREDEETYNHLTGYHERQRVTVSRGGLTIRDAFAMAAMTGIIARQSSDDYCDRMWHDDATAAYEAADAMLRAREANNDKT